MIKATYFLYNTLDTDVWIKLPNPEESGKLTRFVRIRPKSFLEVNEEALVSFDLLEQLSFGNLVLMVSDSQSALSKGQQHFSPDLELFDALRRVDFYNPQEQEDLRRLWAVVLDFLPDYFEDLLFWLERFSGRRRK